MSASEPASKVAPVVALLLAAWAVWPLPIAWLDGGMVGHPIGDLADHVQGAWWFAGELLAGRFPDTTTVTHVPDPRALWYVDPIGAILALPLWTLGPGVAWNWSLSLQVGLATVVAWAVGRDLTGSSWSGVVCAAIAAPSPYLLGLLHSGLSEYVGVAPVIAAVWASLRATGRDPRGRPTTLAWAALAGLFIGLCAWQAFYYAAFAGLFLLCCLPGARWPERVKGMLSGVAVSVVVAAPAGVAMARSLMGGQGAVSAANAPGWGGGGPLPATDLLTWVRPGAYYFPDTPAMGNPGILHVNYLGWVALALTGWAIWKSRRADSTTRPNASPVVGPALLMGVLMLGPGLVIGGRHLGLPLPLALAYSGPSPFDLVHHPYRLAVVGMALLGVLGAVGSHAFAWWTRPLIAALVVAETVALSPAPWPVATTAPPVSAGWNDLKPGAVLDWPPDATHWNRRYQLAQVQHGQPVPWGVNVFLPDPLVADPLVHRMLQTLDDPRARAVNRDVPAHGDPVGAAAPGPSRLGDLGFSSVVVHRAALADGEYDRVYLVLMDGLGPPERSGAWGARWQVPAR